MLRHRFLRLSAYAIDLGLQGSLGILIFVLAARSSDVSAFGSFAFVAAVASIQQSMAAFGMPTLIYGRAARHPARSLKITWPALVINSCLAVGLYGLTLIAFWLAADAAITELYAYAGLRVFGAVGGMLTADAQARSAVRDYVPLRMGTVTCALLAALIAWQQKAALILYPAIWGAEAIAYTTAMLWIAWLKRRVKRAIISRYRVLLYKATPIAVQSVFVIIYLRFDQVYVKVRFGESALGMYAAAAKVAEAGNVFFQALVLFLGPRLVSELRRGSMSISMRRALFAAAVISVAASVLSYRYGDVLMPILYGEGYQDATPILSVYVLSACFVLYGGLGTRALAAQGLGMPQLYSAIFGSICNIILSIAFGEIWGLVGIAFATVLSYALVSAVIWRPLLHRKIVPRPGQCDE